MDDGDRKEQFSRAFLHALATKAGIVLADPKSDRDSIDVALLALDDFPMRPRIEAQLKCTELEASGSELSYPLSLKNYNDLRLPTHVPRLLIVVMVPRSLEDWITLTPDEMTLRYRALYLSLLGRGEVPNEETVRVRLPADNRLDPEVLRDLMGKADRREPL
jgi:hypothetical protein